MKIIISALDGLSWGLGALILVMLFTGGKILHLEHAKIEFSSLDAWVWVWLALLVTRWRIGGRQISPVWLFFKNHLDEIWTRPDRSSRKAGWAAGLLMLALFVAHVFKHYNGMTHAYDVTFIHQALFHWISGPVLKCDLCDGGTYLGEHLAFTLIPLGPIASIFRGFFWRDAWIFFLQFVIFLSPVYYLWKKGPWKKEVPEAALLVCLIFFSHRAVRGNLIWDFREDHIAFGVFCLAILSLFQGRIFLYAAWAILAAACKENIAMILPFLAAPILFEKTLPLSALQRKLLASTTVVVSFIYLAIAFRYLIPIFNPIPGTNEIAVRLHTLGSTPAEILINSLTSPSRVLKLLSGIFTFEALKYLVLLLGPWFYFSRKAWIWWIPALPGIGMNLISGAGTQRSLNFHYEAIILPFLLTATLLGIQQIARKQWALGLAFALAFSSRWPGHYLQEYWPDPRKWAQTHALDIRTDPGVSVAASLEELAHLNQMRELKIKTTE
mgnify:CR=1 FL=1